MRTWFYILIFTSFFLSAHSQENWKVISDTTLNAPQLFRVGALGCNIEFQNDLKGDFYQIINSEDTCGVFQHVFHLMKWDGYNWNSIPFPINLVSVFDQQMVRVATTSNGEILLCSDKINDTVNGIPFPSIRKYDGTNWTKIGNSSFKDTFPLRLSLFQNLQNGQCLSGSNINFQLNVGIQQIVCDAFDNIYISLARSCSSGRVFYKWDGTKWTTLLGNNGNPFLNELNYGTWNYPTTQRVETTYKKDIVDKHGLIFGAITQNYEYRLMRWDGLNWTNLSYLDTANLTHWKWDKNSLVQGYATAYGTDDIFMAVVDSNYFASYTFLPSQQRLKLIKFDGTRWSLYADTFKSPNTGIQPCSLADPLGFANNDGSKIYFTVCGYYKNDTFYPGTHLLYFADSNWYYSRNMSFKWGAGASNYFRTFPLSYNRFTGRLYTSSYLGWPANFLCQANLQISELDISSGGISSSANDNLSQVAYAINIAPNPNTGTFSVSKLNPNPLKFQLFDAWGRMVYQREIHGDYTYAGPQLLSGIYIARFTDLKNNSISTKKIIVSY